MLNCVNIRNIILSLALLTMAGCDSVEQNDTDFLKKGIDLYSKGEYAKAKLELKNAIQKNPDVADSYYYMALLNEKSRNFKAMRVNLLETIKLDPENIDARVKLAKVHLLFNDTEKSLAEVELILSRQAENLAALTVKAQALEKQEKTKDAMDLVDLVLTKDPDYIDAMALKAVILMKKQSYDEALATVKHGLNIDDKNVSFYLLKIRLDNKRNDITSVINDYQSLLKLHPDNDAIKYALVKAHVKNGEKHEAESILRQLVKEKPENSKAKLILLEFLADSNRNDAFKQLQDFLSGSNVSDKIDFAKWALSKNNRNLANKILNEIVAEEGDSKQKQTTLFMLASMSFQQRDYEKSEKLVENILQINPDYVDAKILKAGILLTREKYSDAEELLNNILWEKPDSDRAMVLLAKIYLERGDNNKANNKYIEALKINPANMQALMPVVNKAIKNKHNDYAKELLQRALFKDGQRLDLMQMLVKLDFADKDWNAAEKLIKWIETKKNGQLLGRFLTAQLLTQQKKCQQAIEIYKEILAQYPWQSASLSAMAGCYEQLKTRPEMVKYLNHFIKQNPDNVTAYLLKKRLLILNGKQKQAINLLKHTLEVRGNLSAVYRELAELYRKKGDMSAALASYQQGLKKYPNDIKLLMALASYYEQQQQLDQAIMIYDQVLSIAPALAIARNNLASILLVQGAEKDIEKAVKLTKKFKQSEQPYFLDTYAWAQFKNGNINDALTALRKVVILAPDIPVFRYHLAEIYHKQKDRSGAIMELRQALDLGKKTTFVEVKNAKYLLNNLLGKQ